MISRFLIALVFVFGSFATANAAERASPEEAKAMAERAAAHIESVGVEAAAKDFMTKGGEWHDRDLYVFIFDSKGVTVAHGAKETLVGRDLSGLRDVDGKAFVKEFYEVEGAGWVDYKWQNPTTNAVEQKTSYIISVGDHVVGVGAYKYGARTARGPGLPDHRSGGAPYGPPRRTGLPNDPIVSVVQEERFGAQEPAYHS